MINKRNEMDKEDTNGSMDFEGLQRKNEIDIYVTVVAGSIKFEGCECGLNEEKEK